jgi:hypothetical protein
MRFAFEFYPQKREIINKKLKEKCSIKETEFQF